MASVTLDEVIINFVQENKFIYDKSDKNFKNNLKKKDVWSTISEKLKSLYNIEMSAQTIEKRWFSLRDMFSRECRRQKQQPSGSGYEPVKEWDLYKNMQFLSPHVTHRRTKTSLIPINQTILPETNTTDEFLSYTDDLCLSSTPIAMENMENIESTKGKQVIITDVKRDIIDRPDSAISSCSESSMKQYLTPSSSSHFRHDNPITLKRSEKITLDLDCFAKRRKSINEKIEEDLQKSTTSISSALKSIENIMSNKTNNNSNDGYMFAIAEGLQHVQRKNKTQCLIEILQVIQKYEDWQK